MLFDNNERKYNYVREVLQCRGEKTIRQKGD